MQILPTPFEPEQGPRGGVLQGVQAANGSLGESAELPQEQEIETDI